MAKREKNKNMLMKALTDPKFRELLKSSPQKALGLKTITDKNKQEIAKITQLVSKFESDLASLADQLLCANGGGCGIG
jgi:hypothetical protein